MLTGTDLYNEIDTLTGFKREELIVSAFLALQELPNCLFPVKVSVKDKSGNNVIEYEVLNDYLSYGTKEDYFRLPMTPMAAQKIANHFSCILPTKKMVDQIWSASTIKLNPLPIAPKKGEATRDSSITYRKHERMIDDQLKGRAIDGSLIAGHKKDVINSAQQKNYPNKVCIYGWHHSNGQVIQPKTFVHYKGYVDYSHGIRLIKKDCLLNDQTASIEAILKDKELSSILSDEGIVEIFNF